MKKLLLCILICIPAIAQNKHTIGPIIPVIHISQLPSVSTSNGMSFYVDDSLSGTCTTGGGTIGVVLVILCRSNGSTWTVVSGAPGANGIQGPAGNNGTNGADGANGAQGAAGALQYIPCIATTFNASLTGGNAFNVATGGTGGIACNVPIITLTGNVTSWAFSTTLAVGAYIQLQITQDGTGGWTVTGGPGGWSLFQPVVTLPSTTTLQTFRWDGAIAWPVGTPTVTGGAITGSFRVLTEQAAPSTLPASTQEYEWFDTTNFVPSWYNSASTLGKPFVATQSATATSLANSFIDYIGVNGAPHNRVLATADLPSTAVQNNATNTGGASMTLNMAASTSAAAFRVPNLAGASSTTAGAHSYDTTNKNHHMGANGVDNFVGLLPSSISPTNNDCVKFTVAAGVVTLNTAGAGCSAGGGFAGTNAQTGNYTAIAGDTNKLITMNGSSITLTLPAAVPSATWNAIVINLHSTALTISRNGLTINGGTSNITLQQFQWAWVFADGAGTNYNAKVPYIAGTNVTFTPAANGITVAAATTSPASLATIGVGYSLPFGDIASTAASTLAINAIHVWQFVCCWQGVPVTTATIAFGIHTGQASSNVSAAIFADSAGAPGSLLGSTAAAASTAQGPVRPAMGSPLALTLGTTYWVGISTDTAAVAISTEGATANATTSLLGQTSHPRQGRCTNTVTWVTGTPTWPGSCTGAITNLAGNNNPAMAFLP